MKRLIAAAILFCTVIGVCAAGNRTVAAVEKKAAGLLESCEEAISEKDEKAAADYAKSLESYWRSKRTLLAFFTNHGRYEDTLLIISRISEQLQNGSGDDALADCSEARRLMGEIVGEQQLRLDHIL